MKKKIALIVFIVLILGSVYALYRYIVFNENYASSNAVFVKSDSLTFLSFKLPGKIEKIYVKEGQNVKKGELLAKLTTKTLEFQQKSLQNDINSLSQKIEAAVLQKQKLQSDLANQKELINSQIKKLNTLIEAKAFGIDAKRYNLKKLKSDYERFKKLYLQKRISREKFETVKTAYFALRDEIKADEKTLNSMFDDIKMLQIKLKMVENSYKDVKRLSKMISAMKYQKKALDDKLKIVNRNIKNSYIYAPFNATVAKKFANTDEVVAAGQKILSIVNLKDLYVLDLLEETKMKGIAPGCSVKIHIDALDKDFKGKVSKILPASAATFALVPRDISSGEFTKLAQRFYVRIKFDEVPKGVLVGMSGEVTIEKCNRNEK